MNETFAAAILTSDGSKNKYDKLVLWMTCSKKLTFGWPSKRKWAVNKFEHGLLTTYKKDKKFQWVL